MDPTYRESYRRMIEMVGKLHDAGVPLVAGTDDFAGFAYHRELEPRALRRSRCCLLCLSLR